MGNPKQSKDDPAESPSAVPAEKLAMPDTVLPPEKPRTYVVAPNMKVSSLRGDIPEREVATAADFAGGEAAFVEIVKTGFLVEKK